MVSAKTFLEFLNRFIQYRTETLFISHLTIQSLDCMSHATINLMIHPHPVSLPSVRNLIHNAIRIN